jgi:hypothetical protein
VIASGRPIGATVASLRSTTENGRSNHFSGGSLFASAKGTRRIMEEAP